MPRPPRFFLPSASFGAESVIPLGVISLSVEESHHIRNVLRLSEGDSIELFDRASSIVYLAVLAGELNGLCRAALITTLENTPRCSIHLLAGLVKPDKCDLIVEKCTEAGAASIFFFRAERSQFPPGSPAKVERWRRISEAALKQSHGSRLPDLRVFESLGIALEMVHPASVFPDLRLVLTPPLSGAAPSSTQDHGITRFFQLPGLPPGGPPHPLQNLQEIADSYIIVGPEGGLTDSEVTLAAGCDYVPCSLGANVLRTETAAIIGCGILRAILG